MSTPNGAFATDYEECGDCGYDHAYDPQAAHQWHMDHPCSYCQYGPTGHEVTCQSGLVSPLVECEECGKVTKIHYHCPECGSTDYNGTETVCLACGLRAYKDLWR